MISPVFDEFTVEFYNEVNEEVLLINKALIAINTD